MKGFYADQVRECPYCHSNFIPAPYHIYKYQGRLVCRWNCQVALEKAKVNLNKVDHSYMETSKYIKNHLPKTFENEPVVLTRVNDVHSIKKKFYNNQYIKIKTNENIDDYIDKDGLLKGWVRYVSLSSNVDLSLHMMVKGGIVLDTEHSFNDTKYYLLFPTEIVLISNSRKSSIDIDLVRKVKTDAVIRSERA